MIDVEVSDNALNKSRNYLVGIPGGFERALVSSFNRAIQHGRTVGTKEATSVYTVKPNFIRKTMKTYKANRRNLSAELVSTGPRLTLKRFHHRPTTDTTGNRRRPIYVNVKKGNSGNDIFQGFVWGRRKGIIMQRQKGVNRLPIQQKFSVSPPQMLNEPGVTNRLSESMSNMVEKRLEHETYRILMGYGE